MAEQFPGIKIKDLQWHLDSQSRELEELRIHREHREKFIEQLMKENKELKQLIRRDEDWADLLGAAASDPPLDAIDTCYGLRKGFGILSVPSVDDSSTHEASPDHPTASRYHSTTFDGFEVGPGGTSSHELEVIIGLIV